MLQFLILSVCSVLSVNAAYSSGGVNSGTGAWNGYETYGSKYPYTNSQPGFVSTSNGGGYGGGYAGTSSGVGVGSAAGAGGFGFPGFAPVPNLPPLPTPYEQQQYFQNLMANFQHLFNQQQAFFNNYNRNPGFGGGYGSGFNGGYAGAGAGAGTGGFGGGYGGGYGGGANYAGASGSYGPGGVHQTASIYPSNPSIPNVNSRFGPDEEVSVSHSGGPPGYVGISTSSFSSSSDVNGQKQGHREAVTSVNDNGKVTTYRVHS